MPRFEVDYDEGRRFRDGFAGKLSDDDLDDLVGRKVERFKFLGNHVAEKGTAEWRIIAQGLCVAAYEAMTRQDERNAGDFSGTPSHPMLATIQPVDDDLAPVSLTGLLTDFLSARKCAARKITGPSPLEAVAMRVPSAEVRSFTVS